PVVLHAAAVDDGSGNEEWCGLAPVRRLLARYPGLRLVIAHFGSPDHEAFMGFAEEHPEVWFDTAMVFTDPPYMEPSGKDLDDRIGRLGDRVVFGSDFPTIPHAYAAQVSGLAALGLGNEWLRKVLWDNGIRLFGL
ncbi:MAG: amidohydrolase family protein, partial [Acidimicrobiales bacterium]